MRRWTVIALSLGALVLTLAATSGADPSWLAPAPAPAPVSAPAHSPWRSAAAIALVMALGGFALYARARRNGTLGKKPATTTLRVIETTRVGTSGQLVIAEVGGRLMLLGVTANNIRRIATLPRAEPALDTRERESEERTKIESAPTLPATTFASALKTLLHAAPAAREPQSAALAIAERTTDTDDRSASRRRTERPALIEGQAAGLRRRRA